ncbi:MAG TPA: trehalose-phosphatase [Actinomycetes bacterium]|nr:trehalose-phosphatase [Actinomycetes bacterium]
MPAHPQVQAVLRAARAHPDQTLVALDYDGTLAPIVDDPEQARPLPETVAVLTALSARVGLVAVVTGRPAGIAVRLGSLDRLAGRQVVVRGAYGAERWDARTGTYDDPPVPPEVAAARVRLQALVEAAGTGVVLEDKGRALAVHTRRADDPAGAFARLRPVVAEVAAELGLRFEPGRQVLEVRPAGVDKGAVLRELVRETGAQVVVYAGDDLGDEPAFEALRELRAGGLRTLGVLVASAEVAWPDARRDELVDLEVAGPAGLLDLLGLLSQAS